MKFNLQLVKVSDLSERIIHRNYSIYIIYYVPLSYLSPLYD